MWQSLCSVCVLCVHVSARGGWLIGPAGVFNIHIHTAACENLLPPSWLPFFEYMPVVSLHLPHLLVLAWKQPPVGLSGKRKITQRQSLCGYFNPNRTFSWPSCQCLLLLAELSYRKGFSDYPLYFVRSYFQLSWFPALLIVMDHNLFYWAKQGAAFSSQ